MVLVWPRSTKPLEGSMEKPLCCSHVTLSRLNSTICRALARLAAGTRHPQEAAFGWGGHRCPALIAPQLQEILGQPNEGQG